MELDEEEYLKNLQLAYGNDFSSGATAFKRFTNFRRSENLLELSWLLSTVVSENSLEIRQILNDNNCCIYHMIKKELNIHSNT